MRSWDTVLIEWINCLEISAHIQSISDLYNGDFLLAILQILTRYDLNQSITQNVQLYLKSQFPNTDITSKELKDYTETDLSYICSLLMYCSCINDGRDDLTSPLCSKLTTDTQVAIKEFLEIFQDEQSLTDYDKFLTIFPTKQLSFTPKFQTWQSRDASPYAEKSPLHNFLKTPARSTKMLERDRTIKNLRQELEAEKYEKEDLSLELREHKEKIQKLSKQVYEKSVIISHLREEINNLETQSNSQNTTDIKEVEKLLKAELRDSQEYVEQLQEEQRVLAAAMEQSEIKAKKFEEEACFWRLKGLNHETEYNDLSEKYKDQELELNKLRLNCNELRALLEEASTRREPDDYECSFRNNVSCLDATSHPEDLACHVVEVQLREAQEENVQLNVALKSLSEKNSELEKNINEATTQFSELNEVYKNLQTSKSDLEGKIVDLRQSHDKLQGENEKFQLHIDNLNDELLSERDEMKQLKDSLVLTKKTLEERDNLIMSLENELSASQASNVEFQKLMDKRNKQLEDLRTESEAIEIKLKESLDNYRKKSFDCESIQKLYKELDEGIETNLRSLEKIIYGSNEHTFDHKIDMFKVFLDKLSKNNEDKSLEIDNYKSNLASNKELISTLDSQIEMLTKQDVLSKASLEKITVCLETTNNRVEELEQLSKEQVEKIDELNSVIDKLNNNIETMESAKHTMEQKYDKLEQALNEQNDKMFGVQDENINLMDEIERLEGELLKLNEEMAQNVEQHKVDIQELESTKDKEINKYEKMYEETKSALTKFESETCDERRAYLEEITQLKEEIDSKSIQLGKLELDLSIALDDYNLKVLQIQELETEKQNLLVHNNHQVKDLSKKLHLLELTASNMENELHATQSQKSDLEELLEQRVWEHTKLQEENNQYIVQCEKLCSEVQILAEKVALKESLCCEKDDVLSKLNRELLTLKLELETKHKEISQLKEKTDELYNEKTEAVQDIENLTAKCEKLDIKLGQIGNEMTILEKLKGELSVKLCDREDLLFNALSAFSIKSDDLHTAVTDLVNYRNETEEQIRQLQFDIANSINILEQTNEKYANETNNYNKQIRELENNIISQTQEIESLRSQEITYLQEIGSLKDELNYMTTTYTGTLQLQQEQKIENEAQITTLTENLANLVEKFNVLDAKHTDVLTELEYSKQSLGELKLEKQQYEMELVKQKQQFENEYVAACEQYKSELFVLTEQSVKYESDIKNLNECIEQEKGNKAVAESELVKTKSELEELDKERYNLVAKLEAASQVNTEFEAKYDELKIEYENYMRENMVTLSQTHKKMEETVASLTEQKLFYEDQLNKLKLLNDALTEEITQRKCIFNENMENKNQEIKLLDNKLREYESNLAKLQKEQENLIGQINTDKTEYVELEADYRGANNRLGELEEKISKLQCAYEIIETGKQKIERQHAELTKKYHKLESTHRESTLQHKNEIDKMQERVDELQAIINENVERIKIKDASILEYSNELKNIKNILNVMETERDNEIERHKSTRRKLCIIEEDNEKLLNRQMARFEHVKAKYEQIKSELIETANFRETLRNEVVSVTEMRNAALATIAENKEELGKFQQIHDNLKRKLASKESTIESLQDELEAKLEQLELLSWEKLQLNIKLNQSNTDLETTTKAYNELLIKHKDMMRETEENLLRAHNSAIDVKNDLMSRVESSDRCMQEEKKLRLDIQNTLDVEQESRKFFELQVLELKSEHQNLNEYIKKLKNAISIILSLVNDKPVDFDDDQTSLDDVLYVTEERIVEIFSKLRKLGEVIDSLEKDKSDVSHKLGELNKYNNALQEEKEYLLNEFKKVQCEKEDIVMERDKETKCLENLRVQYDLLKDKMKVLEMSTVDSDRLKLKFDEYKQKNERISIEYDEFLKHSKLMKTEIDTLLTKRNMLEDNITTLRDLFLNMQIKSVPLNEDNYRLHNEQKQALEIVIEDILKQFSRLTKMAYNKCLSSCQIVEKTVSGIITGKAVNCKLLIEDLGIKEIYDKIEDLYDNSQNTLEQLRTFIKSLDILSLKKSNKENVLKASNQVQQSCQKPKDDEWKKKYMDVKQRLTLIENAKNNYEKKLKQLRAENHQLKSGEPAGNNEQSSRVMEQYKKLQDDHQQIVESYETKLKDLINTIDQYKANNAQVINREDSKEMKMEMENLRHAYLLTKSDLSKLEIENVTLQKILNDKDTKISDLTSVKEAYEKMFEENNKLLGEVDTLKYKRTRDRDEYVRLIKKEKEDGEAKIKEVRNSYEIKLENMKEKMIKLYKDEIDKQSKLVSNKDENIMLLRIIDSLKEDMKQANIKIQRIEADKSIALRQLEYYQRMERNPRDSIRSIDNSALSRRESCQSLFGQEFIQSEERRYSTLPKSLSGMDVIEEVRISRRTSINPSRQPNLEMEDEGDEFNNKYLADLKEGRCELNSDRESTTSSRLSTLAYRNSLCPPHLKSSYPAETQFMNPRKFRDDDLKSGHIDLDDSMSTRLLPPEKSKRKDIGTTSYKRPGPPTPSKNGGRLSLQGNERDVVSHEVDSKTPKRVTPNRLRALFSRSKDATSENTSPTKGKRLSIFRKPR